MPREIDNKPDETSVVKQSGIRRFLSGLLRPKQSSSQPQNKTTKFDLIEKKKRLAVSTADLKRLDNEIATSRSEGANSDDLTEMEQLRKRLASFIEDEKARLDAMETSMERGQINKYLESIARELSSDQSRIETKADMLNQKKRLAVLIADLKRLDKQIEDNRQKEGFDEELLRMEQLRERLASFIEEKKTQLHEAKAALRRREIIKRLEGLDDDS